MLQANETQYAQDSNDASRTVILGPAFALTLAAAYGMTYMVLTEVFSRTSGAHLNPAITIASIVARRVSPPFGLLYIMMQCLGGICGALMIKGMARGDTYGDIGKVTIASRFDSGEIFGIELVATSLVVLTWMSLADPRLVPYGQHRKQYGSPAYIGGVYFATVLLTVRPCATNATTMGVFRALIRFFCWCSIDGTYRDSTLSVHSVLQL